jgi:hypothetical protein
MDDERGKIRDGEISARESIAVNDQPFFSPNNAKSTEWHERSARLFCIHRE